MPRKCVVRKIIDTVPKLSFHFFLYHQEAELNQKYEGVLHDRIVAEKDKFRIEIAEYVARTRGIQNAIDGAYFKEELSFKGKTSTNGAVAKHFYFPN